MAAASGQQEVVALHRGGFKEDGEAGQFRIVVAQSPTANLKYAKNRITNTKYSIITFVPKNIKEQFSRPMNCYFLLIACLQLVKTLTPVNPLTTVRRWRCAVPPVVSPENRGGRWGLY